MKLGAIGALWCAVAFAEPVVHATSQTVLLLRPRRIVGIDPLDPSHLVVSVENNAPLTEFLTLQADQIAAPGQPVVAVSGWALVDLADQTLEQPATGDLSYAFLRLRRTPAVVTLGRQFRFAGAARSAHFDGATVEIQARHVSVAAYGGLTALPRFGETPEYVLLGSRADSLLRDPAALSEDANGFWQAGSRVETRAAGLGTLALSFHHEREHGAIARETAGVDCLLDRYERAVFWGDALVDTVSGRLAEARGAVDWGPLGRWRGTFDALHSEPDLWISRRSIFSVFSMERFDEGGGDVTFRLRPRWSAQASFHVQSFEEGLGARGGTRLKTILGRNWDGMALIEVRRVVEPENGYVLGRAAASYRFANLRYPFVGALDFYVYRYDQAIEDSTLSFVNVASLEARVGALTFTGSIGSAKTPLYEHEMWGLVKVAASP